MKKILIILTLLTLTSCGKPKDGKDRYTVYVPTPTKTSDATQADIDYLIKDENDYREALGQPSLVGGLTCSVVQVASGQCLSAASTAAGCNAGNVIVTTGLPSTYTYKGLFNQPNSNTGTSNLLPEALRPSFVGKNYKINCTGYVVVTETNYYDISLDSDDGSILTIDGTQVINNDNNHGMSLKTNNKFLRRGIRSFNLQYAQTGGGNFGLILKVGGENIEPRYYVHQ